MKLDSRTDRQLELDVLARLRIGAVDSEMPAGRKPKSKASAKSKRGPKGISSKKADAAQSCPLEWSKIRQLGTQTRRNLSDRVTYVQADAAHWLAGVPSNSFHAVVTDPPYGVIEYSDVNQEKLRAGKGGVWRIPPSFDGAKRNPLPRFTVLSAEDRAALIVFFATLAKDLPVYSCRGGMF